MRRKLAECYFKEIAGVTDLTITEQLGYPRLVVDHILRVFARHGLMEITGPRSRDEGEVKIDGITEEIVGGGLCWATASDRAAAPRSGSTTSSV